MDRPDRTSKNVDDAAAAFCDLFPAIYLRFCRRQDDSDVRLTPQQNAVLQHLMLSGPLTVGEMALHFARAQSVVSEILAGLEDKGFLERMRDARDRRRSLIWLTDEAREALTRHRQVLDPSRVAVAMRAVAVSDRKKLVESLRALVRAAQPEPPRRKNHE